MNTIQEKKPLVTFALLAYKQEEYIRDAIAGALSQSYSPLQIILSDDTSPDKTFQIMEEMAGQYKGPHRIVLNRTPQNLGLGGHVNKVMSLAEGELIVVAAGDDISLPERTEKLVKAWLNTGKQADSIHSAASRIDEQNRLLAEKITPGGAACFTPQAIAAMEIPVIGATHAWTKRVFESFGPLRNGCDNEDTAIAFRSALSGGAAFVDESLVQYRTGGVSSRSMLENGHALLIYEQKRWSRYLVLWRQMQSDLAKQSAPDMGLAEQLQARIAECELLCKLCITQTVVVELWRNRHYINRFVFKHATKILFPSIYVRFQRLWFWLKKI